jgi:hypothetical protein
MIAVKNMGLGIKGVFTLALKTIVQLVITTAVMSVEKTMWS